MKTYSIYNGIVNTKVTIKFDGKDLNDVMDVIQKLVMQECIECNIVYDKAEKMYHVLNDNKYKNIESLKPYFITDRVKQIQSIYDLHGIDTVIVNDRIFETIHSTDKRNNLYTLYNDVTNYTNKEIKISLGY
jgi:hypothetical protein